MRNAACALLLLVSAAVGAADVYRSTEPDGTVSYSDRPLDLNSEPISVSVPRAARAAPPPTAAAPAVEPAGDEIRRPAARPSDATPRRGEVGAEVRAQNCAIARERMERYMVSSRLYRTLENGEREYLPAAEIDEARARAAADVETWCD